jgi:hypothetical protein
LKTSNFSFTNMHRDKVWRATTIVSKWWRPDIDKYCRVPFVNTRPENSQLLKNKTFHLDKKECWKQQKGQERFCLIVFQPLEIAKLLRSWAAEMPCEQSFIGNRITLSYFCHISCLSGSRLWLTLFWALFLKLRLEIKSNIRVSPGVVGCVSRQSSNAPQLS